MTLHLITGRANSGKTGLAYSRLVDAVRNGERAALVLPTVPDVSRATEELATRMPLGLHLGTFGDIVRWLWAQHGDGRTLSSDGDARLVLGALARADGLSVRYGDLAARCAETLSEQTGESWRSRRRDFQEGSLGALLVRYGSYLAEQDQLNLPEAANCLARGEASVFDLLVFHRFTDFTPSQLRFIKSFAGHSNVIVTLTWEQDFAPTKALDELVRRLEPDSHEVHEHEDYNTGPILSSLASSLFSGGQELRPGDEVRLSFAEGVEAEARRLVEEVALALESGAARSPDQIAVAYRRMDTHQAVIRHAFRAAGIPVDFDMPLPLSSTRFGTAALDLMRFALGARRQHLLNLLRSRFSLLSHEEAQALEQDVRARGMLGAESLIDRVHMVNPQAAELLHTARGAFSAFPRGGTAPRLAGIVASLYSRGDIADATEEALLDAAAYSAILTFLSQISAVAGVPLTGQDIVDGLDRLSVTPRRVERPNHVQVLPVSRLRGRRFETVILGGLNEGEFPATGDELMLPGSEIAELLGAFGGRGEREGGALYEELLFYEAVTRARKRLVLSALMADSDGNELAVSPFFEVVAAAFSEGGEKRRSPHAIRRFGELPSPDSHLPRERMQAEALAGSPCSERIRAAIRRTARRQARFADPASVDLLPVAGPFSASHIEAYLRCPYRWFHERAVGARELEREFDARDEGSFAHAVLARFYGRWIEQKRGKLTGALLPQALDELDIAISDEDRLRGEPSSLTERVGRRRARAWARRIIAEDAAGDSACVPSFVELTFGSEARPVEIAGVALRGAIDRIDVGADGRAVVVDYKRRCSARHGAGKLLAEGLVQLPLYMIAVEQCLGLEPVAGLYRGLVRPAQRGAVLEGALDAAGFTRGDILSGEDLSLLLEEAATLTADAVEGMRAGCIEPRPRTPDSCRGCMVAHVCGGVRR